MNLKIVALGNSDTVKRVWTSLGGNDIEVISKTEMADAVGLLRRQKIDLVLIDAYINGLENICQIINSLNLAAAALLVNGDPAESPKVKSLNMKGLSIDDLGKPEAVDKLKAIVLSRDDSQARIKVLIIDDELFISKGIQVAIKHTWPQAEVSICSRGEDGIKQAEKKNPDIILLDIGLPDINGFEVLAKIREFSKSPILMITADKVHEDIIKSIKCGANDYLVKPFELAELMSRMRKQLLSGVLPNSSIHVNSAHIPYLMNQVAETESA